MFSAGCTMNIGSKKLQREIGSAFCGAHPLQDRIETAAAVVAAASLDQAAMEGPEAFEISATVFETRSGLSFSARSAWETMPMTRSSASTMGILRT